MSINTSPRSMPGLISPQIMMALQTLISEISALTSGQPGQPNPQINMGPNTDTMTPNHNIFAGAFHAHAAWAPGYGGASGALGASGTSCPNPSPGVSGPASPDASGAAPAGGASGSGGSNPGYVDMMMKALKANGAPQDVLDAYMKQYQLLGLVGGGPSNGSSGPAAPIGGASGPVTPSGGPSGAYPPYGSKRVVPGGGGTSGASGPITPAAPIAPGASSPELLAPINWANMPANMKKLQPYIQAASKATGTPEMVIAGSIWQESGGNVNVSATDGGTDQGLMQIDGNTYDKEIAGQHGLPHGNTPSDPAQNIMAGATYMAIMKQKFGTWDLALRGYNSGENGVDVHDPNARPAGTGDPTYIISVKDHATHFANGTAPQNRG